MVAEAPVGCGRRPTRHDPRFGMAVPSRNPDAMGNGFGHRRHASVQHRFDGLVQSLAATADLDRHGVPVELMERDLGDGFNFGHVVFDDVVVCHRRAKQSLQFIFLCELELVGTVVESLLGLGDHRVNILLLLFLNVRAPPDSSTEFGSGNHSRYRRDLDHANGLVGVLWNLRLRDRVLLDSAD